MFKFVISRKFFLVLVTLLVVDVVFGMLSGFFQNVEYFSQKSSATVVSDLAFLEGAIILFLGVVLMFYHSRFGSREANLIVFAVVMFCVSVVSGLVG